jgi:hypothetical protein
MEKIIITIIFASSLTYLILSHKPFRLNRFGEIMLWSGLWMVLFILWGIIIS